LTVFSKNDYQQIELNLFLNNKNLKSCIKPPLTIIVRSFTVMCSEISIFLIEFFGLIEANKIYSYEPETIDPLKSSSVRYIVFAKLKKGFKLNSYPKYGFTLEMQKQEGTIYEYSSEPQVRFPFGDYFTNMLLIPL